MLKRFKIGDCSLCPASKIAVVKNGKHFFCLTCNSTNKKLRQIEKKKKQYLEKRKIKTLYPSYNNTSQSEYAYLKKELDSVFSLYIRLKYCDKRGFVKCFCCPRILHYKDAQCSHYIKRGESITRWLVDNCRPSCPKCNYNHNYNVEPYRTLLEQENRGITEYLKDISYETIKFTRDELKEKIFYYKSQVSLIKKEKGIL
jgi:hypothetical protein